jgi:ABC-type transport system involved in cytochrome c biogenesis permease subunit
VSDWARISSTAFDLTIWLYLGAMVLSFAYLAARRDLLWVVARGTAIAGASVNLVSIVARGVAADRVPWGNMFEYSTVLAFLVVAGTLVWVEGVARIKTLTGFSLMFSVLTLAVAALFFPVEPSPLQPALNSYWIKIHVVAAITGSSLFAIGGIATILFLLKDRAERRGGAGAPPRRPPPRPGRGGSTRRTTSCPTRRSQASRPVSAGAAASCRPPPPSTASPIG